MLHRFHTFIKINLERMDMSIDNLKETFIDNKGLVFGATAAGIMLKSQPTVGYRR